MPGYFGNFPLIDYNGKQIRDITKRAVAIEKIKNIGVPFQPLTVTDQERCDYLSTMLFQRPDYDYMFYMLNDIVDPYYEWYMSDQQLEEYIASKYNNDVQQIKHYYYFNRYELISNTNYTIDFDQYFELPSNQKTQYKGIESSKLIVTVDTYNTLSAAMQALHTPVSYRTYEREENEKRKYLNAILPQYGNLVHRQIRALLNDQPISLK